MFSSTSRLLMILMLIIVIIIKMFSSTGCLVSILPVVRAMHRLQTAPNHRWSSCWSWSWLWLIDDDHHTGFITVWLILNIIPRLPGCYTRQEITHSTLVKPPGSNNKKKHQGAWSWFWNCIYFCFLFQSSWFQYLFLRGIATNLFTTHWSIPEWQAEINVRWQIFEYSDINIFRFSYIPNTVTSIARLVMCFLFRYHCAPFCFRYYWSNTDKWQSSSGTGKSVPIRSSFVAFTVAIKSMQMSSNVTKCHIFSSDVSLRAMQCHQTLVSTLK